MAKAKKGYLQRPAMLPAQRDYLKRKLDQLPGITDADRKIYAHIMACTVYAPPSTKATDDRPAGVPVPWSLIQHQARGACSFRLAPLLTISEFKETDEDGPGYCRRYLPHDEDVAAFLSISSNMPAAEFAATPLVDFVSGRAQRPAQTRCKDDNNHAEPALVAAAMRRLTTNGCLFNMTELEAAYRALSSEYKALDAAALTTEAGNRLQGQWRAATACRTAILAQRPEQLHGELWRYQPAYRAVSTGRIHQLGGAVQTLQARLKRAAFAGPQFTNYDIKSAQLFIACTLIEAAGLDAKPLVAYVDGANYEAVGAAIGVSGKTAKRMVIAMAMGATLPKRANGWRDRHNSILNLLAEYADDDDHMARLVRAANEVLGDIAACLHRWHAYLLDDYINLHKRPCRGGYGLPNAVGKVLPLGELRLNHPRWRWVDVARVAAHLLQGLEQRVIQEMICRDDGMVITSAEHDGFILSSGQPDMRLWAQITASQGLAGLRLEQKSL
jgi:hypothetical protein